MARDFNGTNKYWSRSGAILTAVPITMACWTYPDDVSGNQVLMTLSDASDGNNLFELRGQYGLAGDPIRVRASDSGASGNADTSTGVTVNTWHHAAGVWASASSRTAYIDGGSKVEETTSVTPSGIDTTEIGRRTNPATAYASGRIAEAGIWDVALTDAEIKTLAAGVSPIWVRPANLVAYYPLYGVADPESDLSKNANTLTNNNSSAAAAHAPVSKLYLPPLRRGWKGLVEGATPPAGFAHSQVIIVG